MVGGNSLFAVSTSTLGISAALADHGSEVYVPVCVAGHCWPKLPAPSCALIRHCSLDLENHAPWCGNAQTRREIRHRFRGVDSGLAFFQRDAMNQQELLKFARRYFISDDGLSRNNLIRKIQRAEGHVECFARGKTECEQMECSWRRECLANSEPHLPAAELNTLNTLMPASRMKADHE